VARPWPPDPPKECGQGRRGTYLHQQQQPLDDEPDGHVVGGMSQHRLQAALGEEVISVALERLVAVIGYGTTHQNVVMGAQLAAARVLQ